MLVRLLSKYDYVSWDSWFELEASFLQRRAVEVI